MRKYYTDQICTKFLQFYQPFLSICSKQYYSCRCQCLAAKTLSAQDLQPGTVKSLKQCSARYSHAEKTVRGSLSGVIPAHTFMYIKMAVQIAHLIFCSKILAQFIVVIAMTGRINNI